MSQGTAVIYVIGNSPEGPLKIGVSRSSAKSRLDQIQTGSLVRLKILHREPVSTRMALVIERRVHLVLQSERLIGEWFNVDLGKARAVIAELAKSAPPEPADAKPPPSIAAGPSQSNRPPVFVVDAPLVRRVSIDEKLAEDDRIQEAQRKARREADRPRRELVARLAEGKRKAAQVRADQARLQSWLNAQRGSDP